MTLRLVERYISYQGEGPNTGRPTMFVRFAGCNFKCPGWPCDTQHAIDPKIFGKTQRMLTPGELVEMIVEDKVRNICLTGGEPFLQNHEDVRALCTELKKVTRNIEVFTNGSLVWPEHIGDLIDNFIVDWKLPGSGEYPDDEILLENIKTLGPYDAIKFTISNREDFDRALHNYDQVIMPISPNPYERPRVWCGPVWGALTPAKLARWMLNAEVDWHLNIQSHKYIWDPDTIGV